MRVPEAPVHEDNLFPARKNDVRFAGQVWPVYIVANLHRVQDRTDSDFGTGILALDRSHTLASLFWGEYVHGSMLAFV